MVKIKINSYSDLKAIAALKGIKLQTELPEMLGYKSRWGLKLAMENPVKKKIIIEKAKKIFIKIIFLAFSLQKRNKTKN